MTTSQIIIAIGFIIIYLILFVTAWMSEDDTKRNMFMGFSLVAFIFIMIVWFATFMYMNQYQNEAKGKCPEYEKLENVYKLKQ